tara:strand:+ start:296 stop:1072 length:777 start_codon:yes stop_codon:yes gene_type:complete
MITKNRLFTTILISLSGLILVVLISFFTPIAFTGINKDSFYPYIWLFLTETGGTIGMPIGTAIILLLILKKNTALQTLKSFGLGLTFILICTVCLAKVNEHNLKQVTNSPRPYALILEEHKLLNLENFYGENSTKLSRSIELNSVLLGEQVSPHIKNIHPLVLKHWAFETGFSFPSGHAFISFWIATLLTYLFLDSSFPLLKLGVLVFVGWAALVAISRVAIGAHSALDVSVGGLMGVAIAYLVILTGVFNKLMIKKP